MHTFMEGKLLRVYVNAADKYEGQPIHEVIVRRATDQHLAGATVTKSLSGYGCRKPAPGKDNKGCAHCPLIIEIVDSEENVEKFLDTLKNILPEGLVTVQDVQVALYKGAVSV